MRENICDIEVLKYEGIKIFSEISKCRIKLNHYILNNEDKKYLSLYLGILSTKNEISHILKNNNCIFNIQVICGKISKQEYNQLLNNYFLDIISAEFNSIDEYLYFLLDKEILKYFNKINNIDEKIFKKNNKKLIMRIK